MDYYIIKDNKRQGPFSIERLKESGISADTKVWREGLDTWTDAGNVPELAEFAIPVVPPPIDWEEKKEETQPGRPPMPKTWLAESIIVTLLCCLPLGIIAIIYSTQVESNYITGDYDMAQYKSNQARNMLLWGVGVGAALLIIYIGFIAFSAILGSL